MLVILTRPSGAVGASGCDGSSGFVLGCRVPRVVPPGDTPATITWGEPETAGVRGDHTRRAEPCPGRVGLVGESPAQTGTFSASRAEASCCADFLPRAVKAVMQDGGGAVPTGRSGLVGRARGDDGAIAIVICLLLVLVLLPATALGLSTYTRSAVQAEKVRAADSGALAGAASLALLDASALPANPLAAVSKDGIAFTRACQAALKAADVDDSLSSTYATPIGCGAVYSPDTSLGSCAGALLDAVEALPLVGDLPLTVDLPDIIEDPIDLPGIGGIVPPQTLPPVPDAITVDPRDVLRKLTPALLHNGIKVTLRYKVRGPMDGLLGEDTGEKVAISTARRRFKPLIPQSIGPLSTDLIVLASLRQLLADVGSIVQGNPLGVLPAACLPAAKEVFDDLDDALQVNQDPEEQDLLTCVGAVISGLDLSGVLADILPSVDLDCTDQLFRAQLAPNA